MVLGGGSFILNLFGFGIANIGFQRRASE